MESQFDYLTYRLVTRDRKEIINVNHIGTYLDNIAKGEQTCAFWFKGVRSKIPPNMKVENKDCCSAFYYIGNFTVICETTKLNCIHKHRKLVKVLQDMCINIKGKNKKKDEKQINYKEIINIKMAKPKVIFNKFTGNSYHEGIIMPSYGNDGGRFTQMESEMEAEAMTETESFTENKTLVASTAAESSTQNPNLKYILSKYKSYQDKIEANIKKVPTPEDLLNKAIVDETMIAKRNKPPTDYDYMIDTKSLQEKDVKKVGGLLMSSVYYHVLEDFDHLVSKKPKFAFLYINDENMIIKDNPTAKNSIEFIKTI
jgi:hypothetical protein